MPEIRLSNSDSVVLVSEEDRDLADYTWCLKKAKTCRYVARTVRQGKGFKTHRLSREIESRKLGYKVPSNLDVHHIDADTLNNTRENLSSVGRKTHGHFSNEELAYEKYCERKYGREPVYA